MAFSYLAVNFIYRTLSAFIGVIVSKGHSTLRLLSSLLFALCVIVVFGCGEQQRPSVAPTKATGSLPMSKEVSSVVNPQVSAFAAARFLEQASWGPSPQAIAELQGLGFSGWIDAQLKKPITQINAPNFVIDFNDQDRAQNDLARGWMETRLLDAQMLGEDQLRQRMAWAIFGFIPVGNGPPPYGRLEYFNLLQRNALGDFKEFIIRLTRNPTMGNFLDNNNNTAQNPNENYGRELMQLFTVGLVQLNPDGSVRRNAKGLPLETYSQDDVIAATKALSGWQFVWENNLPQRNWANYGKEMVMRGRTQDHDSSSKRLLGDSLPSGLNAEQELAALADLLTRHPNTAPFVSRRLIQGLVTSDPSPDYVQRVSTVFVASKGNLASVARAILLDPEARAGDTPGASQLPRFGRIKEPMLHFSQMLRGLGCQSSIRDRNNRTYPWRAWTQDIWAAPNVFGYVSPDHLAPQSGVVAPEQRLLTTDELNRRLGSVDFEYRQAELREAGCDIDLFLAASSRSDDALLALIAERYFRGAMPATLRFHAKSLLSKELAGYTPARRVGETLQFVLSTAQFGVIK